MSISFSYSGTEGLDTALQVCQSAINTVLDLLVFIASKIHCSLCKQLYFHQNLPEPFLQPLFSQSAHKPCSFMALFLSRYGILISLNFMRSLSFCFSSLQRTKCEHSPLAYQPLFPSLQCLQACTMG